mgnify:FL=1
MKETVVDVLIYLFERYLAGDVEEDSSQEAVRRELIEAGFPKSGINKALDWIDTLGDRARVPKSLTPSFRVFSPREEARLDPEARGLLMFLEHSGILTPESRELIMDRVLALDEDHLSIDNLKWVVLMVLFASPDEELAFARMEHFVYGSFTGTLH